MSDERRPFVDAHMHLWDSTRNPWYIFPVPGGDDFGMNLQLEKAFPESFLLDDYLAALKPADVRKCVHVTAVITPDHAEAESRWIAGIMAERGLPNAIIGTVDTAQSGEQIDALLDRERAHPAFRGIRVLAGLDYAMPVADTILSALASRDLLYDAVAHPGGIAPLAEALGRHETLAVVLEHIGWPLSDDLDTHAAWRKEMAALAARPNAHCKLSGLPMFVHRADLDIFRRYLDDCIDLFGAERCMFGSNFPVDMSYVSFAEIFEIFEAVAADRSPREADLLFGGTAERIYRI